MNTQPSPPKANEFYETGIVVFSDYHLPPEGEAYSIYPLKLNLRAVLDYSKFKKDILVVDRDKFDKWEKTRPKGPIRKSFLMEAADTPPTKTITLYGTEVLYYNNSIRMIETPYEEFDDLYMRFLDGQL